MAGISNRIPVRLILAVSVIVGVGAAPPKAPPGQLLSVRVTDEVAPPGSIAQIKLEVTEPKPITTGDAALSLDGFSEVVGIALGTPDAAGVAVVRGNKVALSIISPSGTLGLDGDYPVATFAGRVAPNLPIGSRVPMTIGPSGLRLIDPSGAVYPIEVEQGQLTVGRSPTISDVTPGSADLPAGALVTILGPSFDRNTRIRFRDTFLAQQINVSSTRIDVVLGEPAHMHTMRIRARNDNLPEVEYFSYERTEPAGRSTDDLLKLVVPIFPQATMLAGSVHLASPRGGLALQNPGPSDATIFADLFTSSGAPLVSGIVTLAPGFYVVRHISEIFGGFVPTGSTTIRFSATAPVQALGVNVNAAGAATPALPH